MTQAFSQVESVGTPELTVSSIKDMPQDMKNTMQSFVAVSLLIIIYYLVHIKIKIYKLSKFNLFPKN